MPASHYWPREPLIYFLSIVLPFPECYMNRITKHVHFCVQHVFIHDVVCTGSPFISRLYNIRLYGHITICLSKFLLIDLAYFYFCLFMNKAVMNL